MRNATVLLPQSHRRALDLDRSSDLRLGEPSRLTDRPRVPTTQVAPNAHLDRGPENLGRTFSGRRSPRRSRLNASVTTTPLDQARRRTACPTAFSHETHVELADPVAPTSLTVSKSANQPAKWGPSRLPAGHRHRPGDPHCLQALPGFGHPHQHRPAPTRIDPNNLASPRHVYVRARLVNSRVVPGFISAASGPGPGANPGAGVGAVFHTHAVAPMAAQ
jgi:hypothetical protein